jgi:hypothetical protein
VQAPVSQVFNSLAVFRRLWETGLTDVVGGTIGNGPVFNLQQPVNTGKLYAVTVRAISRSGVSGPWSEARDFKWELPQPPPPAPAEPRVAWPARPLPPSGDWGPMAKARTFRHVTDPASDGKIWSPWNAGEYPVGVRIGRMGRLNTNTLSAGLSHYPDLATVLANGRSVMRVNLYTLANDTRRGDPVDFLLPRGILPDDPRFGPAPSRPSPPAESLLPAVLYRRQVANTRFPTVSGDIIQVSPMMERIAHYAQFDGPIAYSTRIYDPYIGVVSQEATISAVQLPGNYTAIDLYLLDTQPVMKGAAYHYTLVRFRADNGEIEETLDAGQVTIPNNL